MKVKVKQIKDIPNLQRSEDSNYIFSEGILSFYMVKYIGKFIEVTKFQEGYLDSNGLFWHPNWLEIKKKERCIWF